MRPISETEIVAIVSFVSSASQAEHLPSEATPMLAEKFILLLEALVKSSGNTYPDGSTRVVSSSPHVPAKLPRAK
jgi:hypothetical protein